ncbi:unnamed protein product, partial [Effrenium voratum]
MAFKLSVDLLLPHLTALGVAFQVTYADQTHRQRILASSLEPLRLLAVELFTLLAPSESDYLVPLGLLAHSLTSLRAASPSFERLEIVFADLPEVWTSVPPMTLPQLLQGQLRASPAQAATRLRSNINEAARTLRH